MHAQNQSVFVSQLNSLNWEIIGQNKHFEQFLIIYSLQVADVVN